MENKKQYSYVALIPAYKPLTLLPELVLRLRQSGLDVVLVDDGSGEEFGHIFDACLENAHVCTHRANEGKGVALKTGLAYILERYGEDSVVVTVDADGQHAIKDALAVCKLAAENPHTLIFGSRKFTGKVPFKSRVGNTMTQISYHLFSGVSMYDTQTGLRAFSGDLIPSLLKISGQRYEYEINMLFEFTKQRIKIIEHEIATIYENNNASSHFHPIHDTFRLHKQIFKATAYLYIKRAIDIALFLIFMLTAENILLSNVISKSVSAAANFFLNLKYGFKRKSGALWSAVKYILLTVGIVLLNTAAMLLLVELCYFHWLWAKLIVEAFGFIVAWLLKKVAVKRELKKK